MKPTRAEMNAQEIIDALADRFAAPVYAFLPQVRDSTGAGTAGTIDALALCLWPSRGLELHGFEVKAYRNDWLRELKKPAKAENIGQFCDRWWIAAATGVVLDGELPPLWGLLVQRGRGLVRVKEAPRQEHVTPIDRPFLCAILRRAAQDCPYARRKTMEYEDGLERGRRESTRAVEYERSEANRVRRRLQDFQRASGISLSGWNCSERIGKAIKLFTSNGAEAVVRRAEKVAEHVEAQAIAARRIADELKVAIEEPTS